jgi:hypothetical protein
MLLPKAMIRVTRRRGAAGRGSTVTANVHDVLTRGGAVATQVTFQRPTGNVEPLAGVQAIAAGSWPPAVGSGKLTTAIWPAPA